MPRASAAKRTAQKIDETPPPAAPETPKCFACGSELTWRDRFYVGVTTEQCKACHQRDWHKRLGVAGFHPAAKKAKAMANRSTGRRAGVTAAASGGYAQQRIATWGERQARRLTAKHMRRAQRAGVAA